MVPYLLWMFLHKFEHPMSTPHYCSPLILLVTQTHMALCVCVYVVHIYIIHINIYIYIEIEREREMSPTGFTRWWTLSTWRFWLHGILTGPSSAGWWTRPHLPSVCSMLQLILEPGDVTLKSFCQSAPMRSVEMSALKHHGKSSESKLFNLE